MTATTTTPDATTVLASIDALAPSLAARAAAVEANRTLTPDVVDDLRRAGVFRLLLPASHSGAEADLETGLDAIGALARADGSIGWVSAIGAGAWIDMAELPRPTFDEIFAGGAAIPAGAFAPSGSIEPIDDGYRLTGRWGFVSGIRHATVLYCNAVEFGNGPVPQLRAAVLDPTEVAIEDTWHTSGLRGTGSEHFHVDATAVRADRTFVPLSGNPCVDTPIVRIPAPSLVGMLLAKVAVGIARGAVDDVLALAVEKVPLLAAGPLGEDALFRHDIGAAHADVLAAEALLADVAGSAWDVAVEGRAPTLAERADQRAAAAWATARAATVTDTAYRLAGGSAVYADGPLQRRWRDVHAVTQHFVLKDATFTASGAVLTGADPGVAVF